MAYRRRPAPAAPPLGGIVIDGSNVVASARARAGERVELAEAWALAFRPGLPVVTFFDASRALPDSAPAPPPGVRRVVCARGVEADLELLRAAAASRALVLSNDRFFDHAGLRADLLVLQFVLRGGDFAPYAYATWFRARGTAVCVPLADLRVA